MRQCYYFGTKNRRSILLASYSDMRTVAFWKTLEVPHAGHIHLTEAVSGLRDSRSAGDEEKLEPNWEVLGNKNKATVDAARRRAGTAEHGGSFHGATPGGPQL